MSKSLSHTSTEKPKTFDFAVYKQGTPQRRKCGYDVDSTPKRLSPGMKNMLQEEIKGILRDVEEQLEDFASLIEEVQKTTPKEWEMVTLSPLVTPSGSKASLSTTTSEAMRPVQNIDDRPSNAPLRDGFQIVRNLLVKLSHLINHVSWSTKIEDEILDVQSPEYELYYSQYVFQIALFVLQIVGKKLTQFSETLCESSLLEPLDPLQVLDEETRIHPSAYITLHHKGHKFCSSQLGGRCQSSAISPSLPIPSPHSNSDFDLDNKILDTVDFWKGFTKKEGLQDTTKPSFLQSSCKEPSKPSCLNKPCEDKHRLVVEDSNSSANSFQAPNLENSDTVLDDLNCSKSYQDYLNQTEGGAGQKRPSFVGVQDSCELMLRKFRRELELNFNANLFCSRLKDEFKKIIDVDEGKLGQTSSTMILNRLIQCFREASETYDSGGKLAVDDSFQELQKFPFGDTSREADVEDNADEPTDRSSKEDKIFDEAVDRFVEATYKVAAISSKRRSLSSSVAHMSRVNLVTVTTRCSDSACQSTECYNFSHYPPKLIAKGCPFCKDSGFTFVNKESKLAFRHGRRCSKDVLGNGEILHCTIDCYEGQMLHQTHDGLPSDMMEVREINLAGELSVYLEKWIKDSDDVSDYALMTSMMQLGLVCERPIRKGHVQKAVKVLKSVSAASQLPIVEGYQKESLSLTESLSATNLVTHAVNSDPLTRLSPVGFRTVERKMRKHKGHRHVCSPVPARQKVSIDKLWRYYDDLQSRKYCSGPPLKLKLRRNSILDDAFQVMMIPSRIPLNYYCCIKVYYSDDDKLFKADDIMAYSENMEEEIDITDTFFSLIGRNLFRPGNLRLFDYPSEQANYVYPNPATPTHLQWFEFAGVILAFSFLYQKPLEVQLPKCFFKCLLDRPMSLNDLEEVDPLLHKRLVWLKENDLRMKHTTPPSFTIREKMGSIFYYAELMENGSHVNVTEANKREYIQKCVKWKLAERCIIQMQEIRRGFESVLNSTLLDRFTENELKHIIEIPVDSSSSEEEIVKRKCMGSRYSY